MEEEAKELQESEMNEKWKKFLLENEIEKQQTIERLIATMSMSKKRKKGKGKKKKKWGSYIIITQNIL